VGLEYVQQRRYYGWPQIRRELALDLPLQILDFAVVEECQVYSECDAYTAVYGRALIEIEYTDQPIEAFVTACRLRGATASVVLRDRQVTPLGDPAHVERWCSG